MPSMQKSIQQPYIVNPHIVPSSKQMTNVKSRSLMISQVLVCLVPGAGTSLCIWYILHRVYEIYQMIYTLKVLN